MCIRDSNKGVCFYDYRYVRPSYGTQQFIISNFIPQTEYGNDFVSYDKEEEIELEIDNEYIMSPKDLCTIGFLNKMHAWGHGFESRTHRNNTLKPLKVNHFQGLFS